MNEYEGQHRAAGAAEIAKASPKLMGSGKPGEVTLAGQDPEFPVTPNLAKKGSFDITERQGSDQLSVAAGGTSKGGDVPVTPGIATGGGQGKVSVQD